MSYEANKLMNLQDARLLLQTLDGKDSELKSAINEKAPLIHDELTTPSAIQSFPDGADSLPMQIECEIAPVQSGTGDPSPENIRPISGHTGVDVKQVGKTIFQFVHNFDQTSNGIRCQIDNGLIRLKGTSTAYTAFNFVFPESFDLSPSTMKIAFLNNAVNNNVQVHFKRTADIHWWGMNILNRVASGWTDTGNETVTNADIVVANGETVDMVLCPLHIPLAETNYITTKQITFHDASSNPLTVYGGTMKVFKDGTGSLYVDRTSITLNGTQTVLQSTNNRFYVQIADAMTIDATNQTTAETVHSDRMKPDTWGGLSYNTEYVRCAPVYGNGIAFKWDQMTSASDWTTYFTNNPTQFTYQLKDPVTIPLTATEVGQILSLKGQNNLWCSTGDVNSVEYPADTKLYIDKKLVEIQALILENINNA